MSIAQLGIATRFSGDSAAMKAAVEARRANAARLRSRFADEPEWRRLAEAAGVKLPPYGVPVTTAALERWLRTLLISVATYCDDFGRLGPPAEWGEGRAPTLAQIAAHYDSCGWPLKAVVGELLEYCEHAGRIAVLEVPQARAGPREVHGWHGGPARLVRPVGGGETPPASRGDVREGRGELSTSPLACGSALCCR